METEKRFQDHIARAQLIFIKNAQRRDKRPGLSFRNPKGLVVGSFIYVTLLCLFFFVCC